MVAAAPPPPPVHRVRRLSWRASARTPADAFALRTLLQAQGDGLPALLDRVLADAAPPGTLVRLPRLEVALPARSLAALQQDLLPQLEQALRRALADALAAEPAPAMSGATTANDTPRPGATGARDAFVRHLAHGDLPWPQQTLEPAAQAALLSDAAVAAWREVAADPARLATWLPEDPAHWPGAFARWLGALPAAEREALATAWLPALRRALPGGEPLAMPDPQDTARHAPSLAGAAALLSPPQRRAEVLRRLRPALPRAGAAVAWPHADATDAVATPPLRAANDDALMPPRPGSHGDTRTPPAGRRAADPAPVTGPQVAPSPAADTALAPLVPLAGLVLLHPYLPRLLRGLGLVADDGRSIDDAALPRACALLHALACGREPAREFALPLAKLLLGREPDEPLAAPLPLPGDDDHAEADALLDAVREHWPALRGTGRDGLRVSFLQRRGLLSRRDGAWHLQLQREPFDVLLGLLPWGLGFVRLPWMPLPLVVEWPSS